MIIEVILTVLFIFILKRWFQKPDGLPPGEWGWPIIGTTAPIGISDPLRVDQFLDKMRSKHGDIFLLKLGSVQIVFLCNYNLIKKAFSKIEFSFRNPVPSLMVMRHNENRGLILSEGEVWDVMRKFSLRNLRDLGMGKSRMESIIEIEVEAIVDYFNSKTGKPINIDFSINVSALNIIWNLVAGSRFNIDDVEIQNLCELFDKSLNIQNGPINLMNLFPWLKNVLPIPQLKKWLQIDVVEKTRDAIVEWVTKGIREHEKNFDPDKIDDFIDMFMQEMNTTDRKDIFTYDQLKAVLVDMFIGGSDTTSVTLRWIILLMAIYPDIQEKAHQAINSNVPSTTFPSLADRNTLSYVEAVIHESMRFTTLIPIAVMHAVGSDVQFEGYTIPKGTNVISTVNLCHRDKAYWSKPDEFHPEHFLDDEGRFFVPKEGFLPFGSGRRQCIGETFAKMDLFLFIAAILQRFKILPPEGVELTLEAQKVYLLRKPMPFKVVFEKR